MEAVQLISLPILEFKAMLKDCAKQAAEEAVAAFTKVKENPNEEITIASIAGNWNCSKQTVVRRIKDHMIPTCKLGREIAIKRKYLEMIKNPKPAHS